MTIGWVVKSSTSAILTLAPGISAGVQCIGTKWYINVVGTKNVIAYKTLVIAKEEAHIRLRQRLVDAMAALDMVPQLTPEQA